MTVDSVTIRAVRDEDSDGLIDLVGRCFADYPGVLLEVDLEEPELRTPAQSFERMWVAERDGEIVGMIAAKRHTSVDDEPAIELKKLYVAHATRGTGLAKRLIGLVEDYAREHDVAVVDLWSDTRFDKAHAVYEHYGWQRRTEIRYLHDISNTREYYFVKRLVGG